MTDPTKEAATADEIRAAKYYYGSSEIEIDDSARVSRAPDAGGVWVEAWVWLSDTDISSQRNRN